MLNYSIGSSLGFIFWIVVARYYAASEIGLAVALISSAGFVTNISRLGLDISTVRFLAREKDKKGFVNTCLTIVASSTILITILFVLGLNIWGQKIEFVKNSPTYFIAFVVFTAFLGVLPILNNVFIALRNAKYVFIQNIIFIGLKIPLPIIMAPVFTTFGIFGAWGLSLIFTIIISLFFLLKKSMPGYIPNPVVKKDILRYILNFSVGNYIVNFFGNLPPLILPLIILNLLMPEDNAYYYIAFSISTLIFAIPRAFSLSLLAEGSLEEKTILKNLKKAMRYTYGLLIPIIIIIVVFGDKLLLIYGKGYSTSGYLLLSMFAVSGLFVALSYFYTTFLRVHLRVTELMAITIARTLAVIVLSYILIPDVGIIGVGFVYIGVFGAQALYIGIRFLKVIRVFPA